MPPNVKELCVGDPQVGCSGEVGMVFASIEALPVAPLEAAQAMLDEALPKAVAGACAQELAPVVQQIVEVLVAQAELSERAASQRRDASHKELVGLKAMLANTKMMLASQQPSPKGGVVGQRSELGLRSPSGLGPPRPMVLASPRCAWCRPLRLTSLIPGSHPCPIVYDCMD